MTMHRLIPLASLLKKWIWLSIAVLLFAPMAKAFGPPSVVVLYNPQNTQNVQGDQPVHFQNALTITSPGVLPAGATPISMKVEVISAPPGVAPETAATNVTFSQSVLNFTGPNQSITITVRLDASVGSDTGDFAYKISTVGWPASLGITDNGTYINMHVDPPSGLTPPTVSISSPVDGTVYTHVVGGDPVPVPLLIVGVASQSAPVTALTAILNAVDENGTPFLVDVPITLSLTSLGSPTANGQAILPVTTPGVYTVSATATNSVGSSLTSVDFIVEEEVPAPLVVINPPANNPTYTYVRGLTSVTVPYTFTGTSLRGGIRLLTATLDTIPITTATITGVGGPGVGQLVATGTGTFTFDASSVNGLGQHRIDVTATDDNGTASASATFVVAEQVPQIATTIGHPIDGAVYYLPADASPLNIPYDFTSTTTLNAPVTAIAATLAMDSDPASSIAIGSTVGLNTPVVTGSGTFPNMQPGSYALVAVGTNVALGLSATDTNLFTVLMPPPPVISFTQSPNPTYTALTGHTLSIPVAIRTTHVDPATGANIVSQSLTLDDQPVTALVSSSLNTLTATGTVTLSIPVPAAGTTTHTLVANGVDAYGRPATTSTTFDVTVNDPVITIVINSPANNSVYTLPAGGSVAVPFTFTGDITPGATVDTITGNLGGTTNVTISSTTGLGTASHATASGTLTITTPGTYTLTATDTNTKSGLSATTSVQFTVNQSQAMPPLTIAITQAPSATYTLPCGCSPLCIPITFVGKSTGGTVSTMTATLDGKSVSLSSLWGTGTATATGKANLSVNTVGTHLLVVKDTDPYGQTATASVSFDVVAQSPVIAVAINSPSDNAVYTLPAGSCGYTSCCGSSTSGSLSIPFTFSSTITAGATIDALSASLNGCSVSVCKSGLGTAAASGSGTLTIRNTGTYTLTVKATDNTCPVSATKSITFTVRKAGPPTVSISQPTQTSYTSYSGCASLSIPFSFTGVSESGGISSLSASLDGRCVNVSTSGIGSLTATGTGTLSVKSAGSHKLTVTAKDPNGTVSKTFTFTVTVQNPTPSVTISQPANGAVFTYDDGCATPKIPFSIAAQTNAGATISSLKATLNGCNVTVSNSGIGSNSVTGTGTLSICGPGTYTLSATTTSGCVNASATVKFTVKKNPAPSCSVDWKGSICDGKSKRGGHSVPVGCQVKLTYSNGSCSTVRDSAVRFSVYEIRKDGSCGSATIYGSSHYTIDSNNQYCLDLPTAWGSHHYRVDVYNFPDGGTTPKCVGSKEFNTR